MNIDKAIEIMDELARRNETDGDASILVRDPNKYYMFGKYQAYSRALRILNEVKSSLPENKEESQ